MIVEIDVPRSPLVPFHELGVIGRAFVLGVGGQHAL